MFTFVSNLGERRKIDADRIDSAREWGSGGGGCWLLDVEMDSKRHGGTLIQQLPPNEASSTA